MVNVTLAGRLRSTLETIAADPARRMDVLELGSPANAAEIQLVRGEVPDDLLDFLSELDGVQMRWLSRTGHTREGTLYVPSLGSVREAVRHELGEPLRYVMIDDLQSGYACFYEIDERRPLSEARIVEASTEGIASSVIGVCDSFEDYLSLGMKADFELDWMTPLVLRKAGSPWAPR